jgi:uncharacterized protein YjbI with pentapeptide repeats
MNMDRRHLLFAAGALVTSASVKAQKPNHNNRVSQNELDEAVRLHEKWLEDVNTGQRCMFGGRDLSGLQFGALRDGPINLSGADFAQADLSETEADDLLVHHCNFNGANFNGSRWHRPVFAYADMRRTTAKRARWGTSGPRGSEENSPADFSHAVLLNADLSNAQVCGFFHGTKLRDASLLRADLSLSDFQGPHFETSFSGAQLNGALFRHCNISSTSFFNADCSGADFSYAAFSEVRMTGCNLRNACFHGAEIDGINVLTRPIA